MKRIILILFVALLIAGGLTAWYFLGSATGFGDRRTYLYIRSDAATREAVMDSIEKNQIISSPAAFEWLADRMNYWDRIRPGKYRIDKGSSLLSIVRKLRNGQQDPVNLVINKLRTRQDLARLVGRRFEVDSARMIRFLESEDSLRPFGVDPQGALSVIIPDTYTYLWNTTPEKIYRKLHDESERFWTDARRQQAAALGLDPQQVHVLASIVEEETNDQDEKDTVASVYLNRIRVGMPLQADPTIRFALNDFTITRVYGDHLNVASPYNTYRNAGLPPGPICTPSAKTIDAVLQAAKTNYLYFVADSRFNGTHDFSASYDEHLRKARAYQEAFKARFGNGQTGSR